MRKIIQTELNLRVDVSCRHIKAVPADVYSIPSKHAVPEKIENFHIHQVLVDDVDILPTLRHFIPEENLNEMFLDLESIRTQIRWKS